MAWLQGINAAAVLTDINYGWYIQIELCGSVSCVDLLSTNAALDIRVILHTVCGCWNSAV